MNEMLSDYISEKEAEKKELLERQKIDFLLSEGLYEKEYSDKDGYSEEYPYSEFDSRNKQRFYRKVPINITDSEYEQIKELSQSEKSQEKNSVAIALMVIAWIIIVVGVVVGLFLTDSSIGLAIICCVMSVVSGIFILGFAEIIKLLNDIKNK